jgi:hypothetical protein
VKLHLEILAPPQRMFWAHHAPHLPPSLVLYGGTAIALRLGHRRSVDFDFFTDAALDHGELDRKVLDLEGARALQRSLDTLVATVPLRGQDVKLSFFGDLKIGRVDRPDRADNGVLIASPLDLLATKLKALHDRVEAKDYLDIEALLRSGMTLSHGIMAAQALFGEKLNPLDTAKAVGWFKDGGLDRALPAKTRNYLALAASRFDPDAAAPRRIDQRLAVSDEPEARIETTSPERQGR